jgi:hypothetical protein
MSEDDYEFEEDQYNSSLEAAEDYKDQIDTLLVEIIRLHKWLDDNSICPKCFERISWDADDSKGVKHEEFRHCSSCDYDSPNQEWPHQKSGVASVIWNMFGGLE